MIIKPPPIQPDTPAQYLPPAAPATRGPTGAPVREFAAPLSIWVGELTGYTTMTEGQAGGATRAQLSHRFLTRWRAELAPEGLLEINGTRYEITGITPAPYSARRTWAHLHCTRKRA